MKLTFLGTSAANAYPEAFCRCQNCTAARRLGGPSLRKRSAALVNTGLLIDLGPDIHAAAQEHAIALDGVQHCLQTHAHSDHLDASHFLSRSPEYGVVGAPLLHFYASPGTLQAAARLLERDTQPHGFFHPATAGRLNLSLHPVEPYRPFFAGRYQVTAFPARHDPHVEPLLYAVQSGAKAFFYATDTAALPEDAWQAFHRLRLRFDLIVLDHTYGPGQPAGDHLNAQGVIEHLARFRSESLLAPGGRLFATHIAHEGNPPHPELSAFARQHGYEIAYDGLILNI